MTQEQIDALKKMLNDTKNAISEVEAIIADADKCETAISKKYLYAAAVKQASAITSNINTSQFSTTR